MKSFRALRAILGGKPRLSSEPVLAAVSDALDLNRGAVSNRLSLICSWSSRTAELHRIRVGSHGSADVVVKVFKDASAIAGLVPAINELADTIANEYADELLPVSALGCADSIGGVIMPFVHGSSLEQILKREDVGNEFSREAVIALITRAGRLLGWYHGRFAERSPKLKHEAWADLEFRARALFGRRAGARTMLNPSMVSRSYGDFHPGHLLAANDGRLAVIDPPSALRYRFVGRDIARFIDRMIIDVLAPRSVLNAPTLTFSYGELSAAFIRGYHTGSPVALTHDDRVAIEIYLAFLLKKRLSWVARGQWAALLYYGVMLVYRYRRTMNRLRKMSLVPSFPQH
jgi:hypothetical protein